MAARKLIAFHVMSKKKFISKYSYDNSDEIVSNQIVIIKIIIINSLLSHILDYHF